jgi:hypothetical protein
MVELCALAGRLHAFTPASQMSNSLLCHLTHCFGDAAVTNIIRPGKRFAMTLAPEVGPKKPKLNQTS